MLMPKRVKFRKQMRGRMRGKAYRGAEISFGDWGLKALEPGWLSARQIEAARRAIVHELKRPAETRMGKGKGPVEYWVSVIKPGRVLFEVGGTDETSARSALLRARYKIGLKTTIVARDDTGEGS
jgi:large subunit ribosomal protein L16